MNDNDKLMSPLEFILFDDSTEDKEFTIYSNYFHEKIKNFLLIKTNEKYFCFFLFCTISTIHSECSKYLYNIIYHCEIVRTFQMPILQFNFNNY